MSHPKNFGFFVIIASLMVFVSACESTQVELQDDGEPTAAQVNPYQTPVASKAFSQVEYGSQTLTDKNGSAWVLTFQSATQTGNGTTRFQYDLNKPSGGQGTHFAYAIPECASYVDGSASPTPGVNANANGNLEWGPSDLSTGGNTITLDFDNPPGQDSVAWGVADVSLKASGDGGSPESGDIIGPCRGRYTISGTVFLNDNSPEFGAPNDTQNGNEPGLANVEVSLEEWNVSQNMFVPDYSSEVVLTSGDLDDFGGYSFEVVGPPIPDAPSLYRVRISNAPTKAAAINDALFDTDIFSIACVSDCPASDLDGITKAVDLADPSGIDFGFEINVKGALAAFDAGTKVSDGWPRAYWRVQATQSGTKKYGPEFGPDSLKSLLNCSLGGYDPTPGNPPDILCILDPLNLAADFSGDVDDLISTIFNIGGPDDVAEAAAILKNDSKNDAQEGLRTQILASLLNFVTGRGICVEEGIILDAGDTCTAFNETAMRSVVENAIVVLVNSGYTGLSKASSGSVGSNTQLLKEAN